MPRASDSEGIAVGHDVFISHSTRDRSIAEATREHLEAAGVPCWIASRDIPAGSDYSASIIDAITDSRLVLLVLSRASNDSPQVKREVERAASKGIPIVPFRVEETTLSKHMEYFISTAQWLDAFPPPLGPHLERLTHQVAGILDHPVRQEPGPAPGPRPPGPGPARWPGELSGPWADAEARFLGWMDPALGGAGSGAPGAGAPTDGLDRAPVAASGDAPPWGAVISAAVVGGLGLFMSLRGALGSLFPAFLGTDAMAFVVFPGLRVTGLLVGLACTAGNLALLIGARRAYAGWPDGLPLLWGAIRFVAVAMAGWLLASLLIVLVTGQAMVRGPVLGALMGTGFLAAIQIAIVMFFVRRSLRGEAAESTGWKGSSR